MERRDRVRRASAEEPTGIELARFKTFITIQVIFLCGSPLAGGLRFRPWSMLDTAILVLSIGLSGLAFVMESPAGRRRVLHIAGVMYLLAVLDMSINILLSGILGWKLIATSM